MKKRMKTLFTLMMMERLVKQEPLDLVFLPKENIRRRRI
jgi:hypothetical protein